jgi:predicted RNase H-like nuclease (RuvC/YqgF family)
MAVAKTTKSSSKTTEMVLGQAAQQITKAVAELNSAVNTVNQLKSEAEELTLLVANKEEEIASLETTYAEKSRQSAVDFELNMKANAEKVVTEVLRASGKEAISSTELKALRQELESVKANADANTKSQVAEVAASLKAQFENDLRFMQSENKAVAAENASRIGVLNEKNSFLESQVAKLYEQLNAERSASIERAKAGAIGNINVGDTNRKN